MDNKQKMEMAMETIEYIISRYRAAHAILAEIMRVSDEIQRGADNNEQRNAVRQNNTNNTVSGSNIRDNTRVRRAEQ